MGIDFYYMPMSSPCRAVLLAAKALQVDFNLKLTNLMAGEHMKPEFLAMNPQHTIPTLNEDGFYLCESRPIIQYLANSYASDKDESLYPKDPKKRFVVDQRLAFDMGTLYQRFGDLYYPMMLANAPMDRDKVKKLDEALDWLEGFLSKSKYVAADHLTIADFSFAATLATIEAVGHDLGRFNLVTRYLNTLKEELDGYKQLNQQGADQFGQWAKPAIRKAMGN